MGQAEPDGQRRASGLRGLPKLFQKMSKVPACSGSAGSRFSRGPAMAGSARGVHGPQHRFCALARTPMHSPAAGPAKAMRWGPKADSVFSARTLTAPSMRCY